VLIISLLIVHRWLPAGKRSFMEIAPGIVATLVLWMVSGAAFGRYLADYAFAYVNMYAGLASAMIALIFLYVCASIFIYGGELNSVVQKIRLGQITAPTDAEMDPNNPPPASDEKAALP
jgi:membrane protein